VFVFIAQQRETALDIARRKDNDDLITLLTNVKVLKTRSMCLMLGQRLFQTWHSFEVLQYMIVLKCTIAANTEQF